MSQLVAVTTPRVPELVAAACEHASIRFLEFFAANIRNPHARRAYACAADQFLARCADAGVASIAAVQPVHVATWIEVGTRELAAPSVKQRLAAVRHLLVLCARVPALTWYKGAPGREYILACRAITSPARTQDVGITAFRSQW